MLYSAVFSPDGWFAGWQSLQQRWGLEVAGGVWAARVAPAVLTLAPSRSVPAVPWSSQTPAGIALLWCTKPLAERKREKTFYSSISRSSMPEQVRLCKPALNIRFGLRGSCRKEKFPHWNVYIPSLLGVSERHMFISSPFPHKDQKKSLNSLCVSIS